MNKEIKDRWTAALRSGQYEQGSGWLRQDRQPLYCCMGVLCELAAAAGIAEWDGAAYRAGGDKCVRILPAAVRDWAGLDSVNPEITRPGIFRKTRPEIFREKTRLAAINDRGVPFTRIADLIEEQL